MKQLRWAAGALLVVLVLCQLASNFFALAAIGGPYAAFQIATLDAPAAIKWPLISKRKPEMKARPGATEYVNMVAAVGGQKADAWEAEQTQAMFNAGAKPSTILNYWGDDKDPQDPGKPIFSISLRLLTGLALAGSFTLFWLASRFGTRERAALLKIKIAHSPSVHPLTGVRQIQRELRHDHIERIALRRDHMIAPTHQP